MKENKRFWLIVYGYWIINNNIDDKIISYIIDDIINRMIGLMKMNISEISLLCVKLCDEKKTVSLKKNHIKKIKLN